MEKGLVAKASTTINAPASEVWDALTKPEKIKLYMFGTEVESAWKAGSKITWRGEWQGKKYEDNGTILKFEPQKKLMYSHFSPLSGQPNVPENYHNVTIELSDQAGQTLVSLSQDNNADEDARQHSEGNWKMVLEGLKNYLEKE